MAMAASRECSPKFIAQPLPFEARAPGGDIKNSTVAWIVFLNATFPQARSRSSGTSTTPTLGSMVANG